MAISGAPRTILRFAVLGFAIGGPILLLVVIVFILLPASIGILISEAFAIRSWIFHVLNGIASAWVGWQFYGSIDRHTSMPLRSAAGSDCGGHRGGFAYWAVAGFSAGFYKPIFKERSAAVSPRNNPVTGLWRGERLLAVKSRGSARH